MKTSELTGAQLDWAVAKCEGLNPILSNSFDKGYAEGLVDEKFVYLHEPMKRNRAAPAFYTGFHPSTDWALGGAIIEREKIDTYYGEKGWWQAVAETNDVFAFGSTPLIAAMRCYVASKLGDEVELPEGL
jgi:hypothetical protein